MRDQRTDDFRHEIDAAAPAIVPPMERPLYRKPAAFGGQFRYRRPGTPKDRRRPFSRCTSTRPHQKACTDPAQTACRSPSVKSSRRPRCARVAGRLVTYLALDDAFARDPDDNTDDVTWSDDDGVTRTARIPRVIFTRAATTAGSPADEQTGPPQQLSLPVAVTALMKGVGVPSTPRAGGWAASARPLTAQVSTTSARWS